MKSPVLKIIIVALLLLSFPGRVESATYYLTASGAGSAQTASNWNTEPDGSGTAAVSFKVSGDIFIIPPDIDGTVSANWIFNHIQNSVMTLEVNGSLSINQGVVMTLYRKNKCYTTMIVRGSLIFKDSGINQLIGTYEGANNGETRFSLLPGATVKTPNTAGLLGTGTQSLRTTNIIIALDNAANYYFNGSNNQTLSGLPTRVNDLVLEGSGTKTLASNLTVNGYLSLRQTAYFANGGYTLSFGPASSLEYKNTGNRTTGTEFPANFGGAGGLIIDPGTGYTVSLSGNKTALTNISIRSGTAVTELLTFWSKAIPLPAKTWLGNGIFRSSDRWIMKFR